MKATENKTEKLSLKDVFDAHPRLNLKRVCDVTNVCYQYVLKASKQPVAGQAYDPTQVNYDAIQKIFDRKQTDFDAYDWATIESEIKVYEPLNKIEDFAVDTKFTMRKDPATYRVIYMTETHIVFMNVVETQPRVMNHDTFLHQSPRIKTAKT